MQHATPLISTIAAGFVLAFLFGMLATRLRLSPIVGYLLAGIIMGPFTPGFVGDADLASELAEIGVILLMFGVGLHFSVKDLLAVKNIAVPGAAVQIAAATALGMGLAWLFGWSWGSGLVFGLALSVASTVVLLRALEERQLLDTRSGHVAVGWLIVEDLVMVLALVLLPATAGLLGAGAAGDAGAGAGGGVAWQIGLTLAKVVAFVALMFVVGRRVVPWLLSRVASIGSRELFTLAVLAAAFGIATGAAALFGVSFALGAFFAGMVLGESELSHQAGQDSLPLRDAFAVLFFVSVGMLFDPAVLLREPLHVAATVLIIVVGKSLAAYAIVRAFRYTHRAALLIAASLAQIGEFSFILMNLGLELGLLPVEGRDLILAGAIVSIFLNPFVFALGSRLAGHDRPGQVGVDKPIVAMESAHTVLVGYGRVGGRVAASLASTGEPLVVIEADLDRAEALRARNVSVVQGNAADPDVLRSANLAQARRLLVAIPSALEAGEIVATARRENPSIRILARAHLDEEVTHLAERGADRVIMGEQEIARQMMEDAGGELVGAAAASPASDTHQNDEEPLTRPRR